MKNSAFIWLIGVLIVVLGFIYFASEPQSADQQEEKGVENFKIGVVIPLSGEQAVIGAEVKNAYDLSVQNINANGGVNGRLVELFYEDGKCDFETAKSATERLKSLENLQAIFGGVCLGESKGVKEVFAEEIPFVSIVDVISYSVEKTAKSYASDVLLKEKFTTFFATDVETLKEEIDALLVSEPEVIFVTSATLEAGKSVWNYLVEKESDIVFIGDKVFAEVEDYEDFEGLQFVKIKTNDSRNESAEAAFVSMNALTDETAELAVEVYQVVDGKLNLVENEKEGEDQNSGEEIQEQKDESEAEEIEVELKI